MQAEQKLPVEMLRPGMILARPISDPNTHQPIWGSGTVLSAHHIDLLTRMRVPAVGVLDFVAGGQPPAPPPVAPGPPRATAAERPSAPVLVQTGPRTTGPAAPRIPRSPAIGGARPNPRPVAEPLARPFKPSRHLKPKVLDAVGQEVLNRNFAVVQKLSDQVRSANQLDVHAVDTTVKATIQRIVDNEELVNRLIDLRCYDAYTYAHSANVMSLALLTGHALKYTPQQMRLLGMGALLHDIGKNTIPDEILNKPGKLTPDEFKVMQTHPTAGVMLLQDYAWATRDLTCMVFEHHERLNGTGYPLKKRGDQIAEMAQIVAVADFYDALISERCYKKPMPPNQVYQAILNGVGQHFDERIVRAFMTYIVPYPVDCLVRLNSGQIGQVLKVDRKHLMRPIIALGEQTLDLKTRPDLAIVGMALLGDDEPVPPGVGDEAAARA